MTFRDRRYTGPSEGALVPCRSCWTHFRLDRRRIEIIEARAFHRCPSCDALVLIRWKDAVALGVVRSAGG